ncbi:hypothetical protein, partial [Legionella pneumophila]|uniref:hypothetical protein n=1 Tax=Legionella pneumophila TaxID=446 RepID=UPI001E5557C5
PNRNPFDCKVLTYGPYGIRVGRLRHVVTHVPDEWLPTTEPGLSTDSNPYSMLMHTIICLWPLYK